MRSVKKVILGGGKEGGGPLTSLRKGGKVMGKQEGGEGGEKGGEGSECGAKRNEVSTERHTTCEARPTIDRLFFVRDGKKEGQGPLSRGTACSAFTTKTGADELSQKGGKAIKGLQVN